MSLHSYPLLRLKLTPGNSLKMRALPTVGAITTSFTRSFLTSPDLTTAQTVLGISSLTSLTASISALANLAGTGIMVQTGANAYAVRTITGSSYITVTNGSGVSGNPTLTIPDAAITYAKIQNVSVTARLIGRKTAGSGVPEELSLSDTLDLVGSAAQGDILYRGASTWTRLGAGTSGQFLKTLGAAANPAWATPSGAGDMVTTNNLSDVTNIATARLNLGVSPGTPQGRLTLATVTPVMSASQSGKTTIYYTPYVGQFCPIYDGTNFKMYDLGGELSQATTDNTKSPAAVTTNSNYDLFVWNDSGTYRCTRGPAWSSSTSRGTGAGTTELQLLNGIYTNKNAITNGPAANKGTYVGTVRTDGSSQVNFTFGSAAAGGGAAVLGVWNMYNRVDIVTIVTDSNSTWTYSSNVIRAMDNSTSNRVSFISGWPEDGIGVRSFCNLSFAVVGAFAEIGMALDSTTVEDKAGFSQGNSAVASSPIAVNAYAPQLGFHYIQAVEKADGSNTTTFAASKYQGLEVSFRG